MLAYPGKGRFVMKRILKFGVVFSLVVPPLMAAPAAAHHNGYHAKRGEVRYYRAVKPKVRGYVVRQGGGYSYTVEDVINTYNDNRTHFGGTNAYRNWMVDRQTRSGPFDHGFFFDSAIAPRGGDAPYQN